MNRKLSDIESEGSHTNKNQLTNKISNIEVPLLNEEDKIQRSKSSEQMQQLKFNKQKQSNENQKQILRGKVNSLGNMKSEKKRELTYTLNQNPQYQANMLKIQKKQQLQLYNPYKCPPDIQISKKHGKARRVCKKIDSNTENYSNLERCPCCQFIIENEELSLNCDLDQFSHLGTCFPLYFNFIKLGFFFICIQLIVQSIPSMILNANSDQVADKCKEQSFICTFSFLNLMQAGSSQKIKIESFLNFIAIVIQLLVIELFKISQKRMKNEIEKDRISVSDYSLMISKLPNNTTDEEVQEFLEQVFPGAKSNIVRVFMLYDIKKYEMIYQKQQKLIKKKLKLKQKLLNTLEQTNISQDQKNKLVNEIKKKEAIIKQQILTLHDYKKNLEKEIQNQGIIKKTNSQRNSISFSKQTNSFFAELVEGNSIYHQTVENENENNQNSVMYQSPQKNQKDQSKNSTDQNNNNRSQINKQLAISVNNNSDDDSSIRYTESEYNQNSIDQENNNYKIQNDIIDQQNGQQQQLLQKNKKVKKGLSQSFYMSQADDEEEQMNPKQQNKRIINFQTIQDDQQINLEKIKAIQFSGNAIITFNDHHIRKQVLAQLNIRTFKEKFYLFLNDFCRFFGCISRHSIIKEDALKKFTVQHSLIKVQKAPEPSDILWKNVGSAKSKKKMRILSQVIVYSTLIGVCLVLVLIKKFLQDTSQQIINDIWALALTLLASSAVAGGNVIIGIIIRYFASKEERNTQTEYFVNTGKKLTNMFAVNMILTTIISNMSTFWHLTNTNGDIPLDMITIINTYFILFITNSYLSSLFSIFDIVWGFRLFQRWRLTGSEKVKNTTTQKESNSIFEGHPVDLALRYANVLKNIQFAAAVSPLIPIGVPLCLVGLFIIYWVDKYLLVRRFVCSNFISHRLAKEMIKCLNQATLYFAMGNLLTMFMPTTKEYTGEDGEATGYDWKWPNFKTNLFFYLALFGVFISFLVAYSPIKKASLYKFYNKFISENKNERNFEETYIDIKQTVQQLDDYDFYHPIHKNYVLKHLQAQNKELFKKNFLQTQDSNNKHQNKTNSNSKFLSNTLIMSPNNKGNSEIYSFDSLNENEKNKQSYINAKSLYDPQGSQDLSNYLVFQEIQNQQKQDLIKQEQKILKKQK